MPATLVVRYIGYQTQKRTITKASANRQDFLLKPAVTEMGEIVVTDEDPAVQIMREVIRRKQEWRQQLKTYRGEAYTRQSLANDTAIVSISESVSEVFWDHEKGHREVQKSKRQTANIEAADNFAGVSYLPNFYDDDIEIAGFEMMGVTHPKALDYYDFKLIGQTSLDNRTVFKISVTPRRKLQPLFEGTIHVLDEKFALLDVVLTPNKVVNFPPPVQSFNLDYEQQFHNYGRDFWLPIDVRIGGNVKISMVGLEFPLIKFNQLSRITNYSVNTELPDTLYKKGDQFIVDSTAVASDSLVVKQLDAVPLSVNEEKAYATLDSNATLAKAFKPSGFLARYIDDDSDDEESSDPGSLSFLDKVPGSISPDARYNRVDKVFAGLRYSVWATDWLELRAKGGYSTGYNEWNYGGGLSLDWLNGTHLKSTLGWDYSAQTVTRFNSPIYHTYYSIIPNLLGNKGYFDYYRSEGFRGFSKWEFPHDLTLETGFNSHNHSSLSTNTAYDLMGKTDSFRINPPINEGRLQSIDIIAGFNLDEGYNFGVTGIKQMRFKVEHSSESLGSDFNFTKYSGVLSWSFPTFYQRRLFPNTLDINLSAGTYSGDLPFQKWSTADAAIGFTAPFGVLKSTRNRPYEGDRYWSLIVEHNFRTILFETIGFQPAIDNNIGLIIFGGAARTWLSQDNLNAVPDGYQPNLTDGIHWEAGVSINGILSVLRLDFAARLDQPAFLITLSAARLF